MAARDKLMIKNILKHSYFKWLCEAFLFFYSLDRWFVLFVFNTFLDMHVNFNINLTFFKNNL